MSIGCFGWESDNREEAFRQNGGDGLQRILVSVGDTDLGRSYLVDDSIDMAQHFIHFLNRQVVAAGANVPREDWFVLKRFADVDGYFEKPTFHISRRQTGPAARIKSGDIIWLFSVLNFKSFRLPVSLDAKIVVKSVANEEGKIVFEADSNSEWFPLKDATGMLRKLKTKRQDRQNPDLLWSDSDRPIGLFIQTIRELGNPELIIRYSETLSKSSFDFISYRQYDGTALAFELAAALLKRDKVVFWDRYGLPRRLTERKEQVPDESLNHHLIPRIIHAKHVWIVMTKGYNEPDCYAQTELAYAKTAKNDRYVSAGSGMEELDF